MSLKIDNRSMPAEEKAKLGPISGPPTMPKPPEGQVNFSFPEPEIDWAPGVTKESMTLGGIPAVAITSPGSDKAVALLHIHGGGFTGGSPASAYCFMDRVQRELNIDCFSVEYTLAPAAKAPTQVNECVKFYGELLKKGYGRLILAGESAGGNLVLAVLAELKRLGMPLPVCSVCSSPVTDFSGRVDRGSAESTDDVANDYLGDCPADDPRVSPIYADFSGCTPILLQAGELESLKFDSIELAKILENTDCDCTLSLWEGGMHAFGIDPGQEWINVQALQQIMDFIKSKLICH